MEVQTVEKKPNTGKQTVTATEETSSVAERTKEVTKDTANSHLEQKAKSVQSEESTKSVSESVEKLAQRWREKEDGNVPRRNSSRPRNPLRRAGSSSGPVITTTVPKQIEQ
uniref:ACYPI003526 protein n=1 Tax=Acyrthosiphon pisum TaxID=7029 RepID=C4WT49_ACYPI|nr:ACYPI003526 [Acyrthosiphon pisum]